MTENVYKNVTHCIFDMDGLLLGTETLYTIAINRITERYGKTFTMEHKAKTMGFKTNDLARFIVETFELPLTMDEFKQEISGIYAEVFPGVGLMPGAEKLLKHLKEHNIPIALATSSDAHNYELKTTKWKELFSLFEHKVLGGSDPEVINGKPHPDIFLIACQRFQSKPDPSKCLVFEDAPNGVEAALSAGMQVVMVPDSNLPKDLTKKATMVLNSLEEFQPEKFGLPPYAA